MPLSQSKATFTWLTLAVCAWAGALALGISLYSTTPPKAGFDLELLLEAGRRVAAGVSPYDPAMLGGAVPTAVDLFYSYPPPVAQYLALFAGVPSTLMLLAWVVVAVAGLVGVAVALSRWDRPDAIDEDRAPRRILLGVVLPVFAVAPAVLPFTIAFLFGNLDALFPLLYGLMLLAVLAPTLGWRFGGGVGLAIATIAKIHPGSMGLWFLVRGLRERRSSVGAPMGLVVVAATVVVGLVVLAVSIAVGGLTPWTDYVTVARSASAANVVLVANVGPAAQVARLVGGGEDLARLLQVGVLVAAIVGTALVAWITDDPIESFAWSAVASLVGLPITWIHYPVVLLPVAMAAWFRSDPSARPRLALLLGGALVVALVSVGLPVLIWGSVALALVAIRRSVPAPALARPLPALEPSRISRFPTHGTRR
jgi:hypothetical protein